MDENYIWEIKKAYESYEMNMKVSEERYRNVKRNDGSKQNGGAI